MADPVAEVTHFPETTILYRQDGEYWTAEVLIELTPFSSQLKGVGVSRSKPKAVAYALEELAQKMRTS